MTSRRLVHSRISRLLASPRTAPAQLPPAAAAALHHRTLPPTHARLAAYRSFCFCTTRDLSASSPGVTTEDPRGCALRHYCRLVCNPQHVSAPNKYLASLMLVWGRFRLLLKGLNLANVAARKSVSIARVWHKTRDMAAASRGGGSAARRIW